MITHYIIYIILKLTLFLTNILLNLLKINEKVPHYDVWYIFTTCIVSVIYGEYTDDIVLKLINFAILGLFLTIYFLGYYTEYKNKLMALLTKENIESILNEIINRIRNKIRNGISFFSDIFSLLKVLKD